ncbi:MAG: dihydrodipicolinate synthase family protein [bacterium]|nr:dihydrodipicolinate synthase family protein [bacterium]
MFPEDLKNRLKTVHAFAITPFQPDDISQINIEGLRGNLRFLIDRGVRAITLGGGTGEVNALTDIELLTLAEVGLEVAHDDQALILPTLPGNLGVAIELAPKHEHQGARVALAMAPYIRDQTPDNLEGIFQYYKTLAEASNLALMPYNTQDWPPEFFERLAEIDQIIGIKDPCFVPHNLFKAIKRLGDRFVWIGNKRHDPGVLHFRYQAGIQGYTAGLINFVPEPFVELHACALRQDWNRMIDIQETLAPLERLRNIYSEAVLKTGLDLIGLAGGPMRPPRLDISAEGREQVGAAMVEMGLEMK